MPFFSELMTEEELMASHTVRQVISHPSSPDSLGAGIRSSAVGSRERCIYDVVHAGSELPYSHEDSDSLCVHEKSRPEGMTGLRILTT